MRWTAPRTRQSAGAAPSSTFTLNRVRLKTLFPYALIAVVAGVLLLVAALRTILGTSWTALAGEWYSDACLVDANGDGVLDIAGMGALPGSERWGLELIDGLTGRSLWTGPAYSNKARLVCVSPQFFGVDDVDFQLHLVAARSPDRPVSVRLQDHVDRIGLGNNCLRLVLINGGQVSMSPSGNGLDRCDVADMREYRGLGRSLSITDHTGSIQEKGEVYTIAERQNGTHFLVASKSEGGKTPWTTPLAFVPNDSGFRLVSTPGLLVVWGGSPSDTEYGAILGLDAKTGALKYALTQASSWSGRAVGNMLFNGRFVIVVWGFGLHAYDPATGQRVWNVGGR